jgi:hypothetical protein
MGYCAIELMCHDTTWVALLVGSTVYQCVIGHRSSVFVKQLLGSHPGTCLQGRQPAATRVLSSIVSQLSTKLASLLLLLPLLLTAVVLLLLLPLLLTHEHRSVRCISM